MTDDERLAEAMVKLANALDKVSNPETWRTIAEITSVRLGEHLKLLRLGSAGPPLLSPQAELPPTAGAAGQFGRIAELGVVLTQEERERLTATVMEAVKPQLVQFQDVVWQAVSELPAIKLKEAARRIESGKPVAIQRRQGCIFLHFPDDDPALAESFYLNL